MNSSLIPRQMKHEAAGSLEPIARGVGDA